MNKIFISNKQKTKKDVVNAKERLVKLKLIIGAGQATMTPPLGPVLGQYGINIMEFCNEYNTETKIFEKGVALRVNLSINVAKAFYFEIVGPKLGVLIKEYYKKEIEETKKKENETENETENKKVYIERKKLLKDCFKIVIMLASFNNEKIKKWTDISEKLIKIRVLEVLGTLRSCNIYIAE